MKNNTIIQIFLSQEFNISGFAIFTKPTISLYRREKRFAVEFITNLKS
jgi:hypothetical protein